MGDIENTLYEYLLVVKQPSKINTENLENGADNEDFNVYLTSEENWKVFLDILDNSFDSVQLKTHFNNLEENERIKVLKFGVACIVSFVQCNFTGPNLPKEVEDMLNKDTHNKINFSKLLAVNNEDINVNTRYPILLVTAKIIFEYCNVDNLINNWWYWRSILVHQEILEELSPSLLSDADRLYKHFQLIPDLNGNIKATLDIEVAQLYLLFRNVSKAKEHILSAIKILGLHYDLVGALGKRTKYQEKELAQLALKVTLEEKDIERVEADDSDLPKDIPINDDVRLNTIEFSEDLGEKCKLGILEQKLFVTIIKDMLISKPQDELQIEEIMPFIDTILNQKNTYAVTVVTLLLRCKLESKSRRTIERSLSQSEEIISSLKRENPSALNRVCDVFGTGMPPIWKIETQYADLLLNIGLVKIALDIYLKIKLWEEVIVCYTILKLRHKAAEIIREQLKVKSTVKLWCLLGDATDDISCYEKAWEMSKKRSHRAQRHWGQFLFVRKQYEECIPHFEKSLSINPLQANIWFRLGYAALQTENWQTAATAYRRYTTLEPEAFEAWNNLAQAYIKIGNKRNAHQAILEALKCNFDNWKVWENLLVISCDISNFGDVIRSYHSLLDLKEKYLNVEVLNVLVYNVCNDINDCEGQPSQRFLQKTRELLGRVTAIYPSEGYVWELYANLAPAILLKAQRLQRAYRGYTQGAWDKNPTTCQQMLYVCIKLAEIVLDNEIDPKDSLINSIRLNLSSAIAAIKKQDWEETRDLVEQVSGHLEKIIEKIKSDTSKVAN
ncbi:unnamed protein product [Psylliodes chrysocephalus]|uniref:Tetratricopeptide repeat protein 27 n=1 Tax=Psylliodes chrysocephalus TaxID=3402493 RepID=A0A9P0DEF8_9CUCU|nr:unnamed protein product [Psylliodes chrysocephala]